jgi:glutaconate CoA-transferase subunit A
MIGAGVAKKLVFRGSVTRAWLAPAVRGRREDEPAPLDRGVQPLRHGVVRGRRRTFLLPDPLVLRERLPANPRIVPIESPYGDGTVYAVPLRILTWRSCTRSAPTRRARADRGCSRQKEAAFAAERASSWSARARVGDPQRPQPHGIPGLVVDAVVHERGCHPSFAQGYYDRDNRFYIDGTYPGDADSLEA